MLAGQNPEADMRRLVGIIDSMTADERRNPSKTIDQKAVDGDCRAYAGVEAHEVNDLVKQFDGMADMMKKMAGMGMMQRMKSMQEMASSGMFNPGAGLSKAKVGTGKRLTSEERAKQKKQPRERNAPPETRRKVIQEWKKGSGLRVQGSVSEMPRIPNPEPRTLNP